MARQKTEFPEIKPALTDDDTPGLPAMVDALNQETVLMLEANDNANAVAKQLGYEGAMTVGALEDEIRFYQRRTAEACLELGKRLLILKELSPHGEFMKRVELLGFSDRACNRFMQAAFKFSKVANLATLTDRIGSQSKLLELVTMDDDDIQQLANGETVRGLSLDDIDTMTTSQLKAKLREAEANYEAQGKLLEDKNNLNDKLAMQLTAREQIIAQRTPDVIAAKLRTEALTNAFEAEHAIGNKLANTFKALSEHALDNGGEHQAYMLGLIVQIETEIAKVREEFSLHGKEIVVDDGTPWWDKPEVIAAADAEMQRLAPELTALNESQNKAN